MLAAASQDTSSRDGDSNAKYRLAHPKMDVAEEGGRCPSPRSRNSRRADEEDVGQGGGGRGGGGGEAKEGGSTGELAQGVPDVLSGPDGL